LSNFPQYRLRSERVAVVGWGDVRIALIPVTAAAIGNPSLFLLVLRTYATLWSPGIEFPWTRIWAKVMAGGVFDGKQEHAA
jgi:hypothetical protein